MTTLSEFKVDVDQASLDRIKAALGKFEYHLSRHMATAVNRTARTVGVEAAQQLGKVVNFKLHSKNKFTSKRYTKAATLKKAVWRKQNATADSPRTAVKLWGGHPFPVRWHEAYEFQRKRKKKTVSEGIYYRTHVGGGWTAVLDGFLVRQWGGHAYKRLEGSRAIRKIRGMSPGDYFDEKNIPEVAHKVAAERLPIEIKRRLRDVTMAAEGKIKLRSSPDLGNLT
jgi:hypothetical protein